VAASVLLSICLAGGPAGIVGSRSAGAAEPSKTKKLRPPVGQTAQNDAPAEDAKPDPTATGHPFKLRRKAPSLDGGAAWINTAGPIELKQLRGKFVLLDFWTYCCINCMHILPVLKKLEHTYPDNLVVIGVHSAKFETERDSKNITDAVLRYEVEHPVINDNEHNLWDKFGVQSWPSLLLIDPEGYVVGQSSGEIEFEALDAIIKKAIPYYRKKGLLDEQPVHFDTAAERSSDTPLRFPGKILADAPGDRLFIADSNHNRIVITKLDGELIDTVGSGAIGKADGDYHAASFDHPQGMALDGETLYVADTENHMLRKVDLKKKHVTTIAGTGKQARSVQRAHLPGLKSALNSPWALWIHGKDIYVAMAGPHQIWKMGLAHGDIGPYAGNGVEDIADGPIKPSTPRELGFASFAQPSGLAGDGEWLYVADSEGSSIRAVPFNPTLDVRTVIGTADRPYGRLFTFGDVDGQGPKVRLQHPLDVAYRDGQVYVADTYNNKIKVINLADGSCTTLAGSLKPGLADKPPQFDEPEGLSVAGDKLYVADTNNHAIRVIDLNGGAVSTLTLSGLKPPAPVKPDSKPSFKGAAQEKVAAATVKPVDGGLQLHVNLALPAGYKINQLAPMRYYVEAEKPEGPLDRSALGKAQQPDKLTSAFDIRLPLTETTGEDTLKVSLGYYYCQDGNEGLCKTGSVVWTVPVKIVADAASDTVELKHKLE
jgi:thiol-disulfide isomerase/thioredoxin